VAADVGHIRRGVDEGHIGVDFALPFVEPWRYEFVPQAVIDGQVRQDLVSVVHVVGLRGGAKLRHCQRQRFFILRAVSEDVIRKSESGGFFVVDDQGTAGKLVSQLIETVAPDFSAEIERVLAVCPRKIVGPLEGHVVVYVGALGIVAETAEAVDAHGRYTP